MVDGLKDFPEAVGAAFPDTIVQTCIVHLIRSSLAFVSRRDRKVILPDLKAAYRAEPAEAAFDRLAKFEVKWGPKYPAVGQAWRRAWEHVVPLFASPPAIRRMICITNAVESLHRALRKIIRTPGSLPTAEAATKLLYLAIQNVGGQASDSRHFPILLDLGPDVWPRAGIGDKGYDSKANRAEARSRGI